MRCPSTMTGVFALLVLLFSGRHAVAQTAEADAVEPLSTVPLSTILAVYRARQEQIQAFEFEWTVDVFEPKSPLVEQLSEEKILANEEMRAVVALRDTRRTQRVRFVIDGQRIRFEEEGARPSPDNPKGDPDTWINFKRMAVFDGDVGTNFIPDSNTSYPMGQVKSEDLTRGFEYVGSTPVSLAFRGYEWMKHHLGQDDDAPCHSGLLEDQPCVIVRGRPLGERDDTFTLWLDPRRDYVLLRAALASQGTVIRQTDVTSYVESEHGWAPVAWTTTLFWPGGNLRQELKATAQQHALNPQLPESTFKIDFTPGTYVIDDMAGEQYIQLEDGRKRVVQPGEWAVSTYADLLRPPTPPTSGVRFWLLVANIGVICGVAVFVIWRRVRRRFHFS